MIKVMLDNHFNLASPFIDWKYLYCEKFLLLTRVNYFYVFPDINSSFPDNIIVLIEPFIPYVFGKTSMHF